jgi:hypothetical protein
MAIVFHLHHDSNYSEADTEYVEKLMEEKKLEGRSFCINGIYSKPPSENVEVQQ